MRRLLVVFALMAGLFAIARCLDYAARVATGNSWGSQVRLTTGSSNPFIQFADGSFIGDYSTENTAPQPQFNL
jgi:hypothetical protein